jgi:uncharacterized tellurite resistance protein B-like protein
MEQTEKLLKDYSDVEKGSYLGAIASIATADRTASEEELEYIQALADSAELSVEQKQAVERAATELSGEELQTCLNNLKGSELRYSLVTDLIAFAESDQNYTEEEKANIEKIAQYLNINKQQFSLLDQFVKKTKETNAQPEEMQQQGFLGSLGLEDKFKNSGINFGSLTKGLLGFAGPMILGSLLSRGMRGRSGGGLGGMLTGGLGGMFGGGGGLGSLTSMLNGGRGLGSTGGLFSRILRGL